MEKIISFKTSGLSGDIIHQMAGIKAVCEKLLSQADIFVWLDQACHLYDGAKHPYDGVMMNQYAFDMLKPLIEQQHYVNSFQVWSGQEIAVDLDSIRQIKTQMPYGSLSRWVFYKYPDMTAKLHEQWLYTNEPVYGSDKILINRTSRYHNPWISYFFLEKYKDWLYFVGLQEEHKAFCSDWKLDIPYLKVDDFHHLAHEIEQCRFFIGNQSMCYAIAEALKVPRILEVCPYAPNIIPTGPGGHDFLFQPALTYFVETLNSETK